MSTPAFWLTADRSEFYKTCAAESVRMNESREAKLLHSGKIQEPRLWRNEEDFAKKKVEAAA